MCRSLLDIKAEFFNETCDLLADLVANRSTPKTQLTMWGIMRLTLLLAGAQLALGVRLQLFQDFDHVGLISDINEDAATDACIPLKPYARGTAGSVKTDTCLMVYAGAECDGFSFKITPSTVNFNKAISSFRICSDSLGGKQILTDMFSTAGATLGEFRDVCGCQDLPTQVSTNLEKLDNYGNCVSVYELANCKGQSKEIEAGKNADSENLRSLPYRVRSISACGQNPSCIKLQSSIYKFELDFPEEQPEGAREVDLGTRTRIYNNGSAKVSQKYYASKKIRQTYSTTLSSTIRTMESTTIEHTLTTTTTRKSGWFRKVTSSISNTLRNAYTFGSEDESSESSTVEEEEEKEFAVTQTFEVPPCSEYDVSSQLQILENTEIPYWLYAKVTGTSSGMQLLTNELVKHVEGMEYVEDYDEYTAIFRSKHVVLASMGVDTWITGEGASIPNCVP